MTTETYAKYAKTASIMTASASEEIKNRALKNIAAALLENKEKIFHANKIDIERSEKENLALPLLKRLKFDELKLKEVISGIESLIKLDDPVGKTLLSTELDKGLELYKISCPIGVIGIIFESRPDALVQISALCLKSGNAVMLKGGSEAFETNHVLAEIIYNASVNSGIPENWLYLVESRSQVSEMLKYDKYIDLIIPRGSNEFVKYIMDNSNIPVLGHADGICHCFIDEYAETDKAVSIAVDSKTQYVAVCNAVETILVHEKCAARILPALKQKLEEKNVRIFSCEKTLKFINTEKASEKDWGMEYLDYIVSIKTVSTVREAIDHINKYGSGHTDVIVTENTDNADLFMNLVDSGNVFWNCSSRFSDGFKYGFGAEVGISTNKIHARGPVGLDGLLIYKYKLIGKGQTVEDYAAGIKKFKHKPLKNKKFKIN
ncbi:MAG: glutamate-5-semialdehyde dehydrogenase [Spirochaetes bacterium]|nr:glutamate-5-semialdehyde dehydrogenase [Spirochaetota bacterium]